MRSVRDVVGANDKCAITLTSVMYLALSLGVSLAEELAGRWVVRVSGGDSSGVAGRLIHSTEFIKSLL